MRDWTFGFPYSKSASDRAAVTETPIASETADAPPVVVTYARFLERRAWREKIAADFHHPDRTSIDVQAVRSEALSAEAVPPRH